MKRKLKAIIKTVLPSVMVDFVQRKKNERITIQEVSQQINNKVYFLAGDYEKARWWNEELQRYNNPAKAFLVDSALHIKEKVDGVECCAIEDIISISLKEDVCVVVIPCNRIMSIIEKLLDYGLERKRIIIASRGGKPSFGGKLLDYYDVNLGFTRLDDLPGFVIFGKDKLKSSDKVPLIIVTLGGSTTDAYYANFRSWSEILYRRLCATGMNVVLYCGGICSYTSGQELLKLIKDVLPLKPDVVISYSGANDQENCLKAEGIRWHPYVRQFHLRCFEDLMETKRNHRLTWLTDIYNADKLTCGIEDDRTSSDFWVQNEQLMYSICRILDVSFYGFLQPSPEFGEYIKDSELAYSEMSSYDGYTEDVNRWYGDAVKKIENLNYLYDLSGIFNGLSGIYIDECHVFEKGNKIIADHIFRTIIRDIRKIKK